MLLLPVLTTTTALADSTTPPPRQLYNEGTQKLRDGKLIEAENTLQNAVATQNVKVQGPALYNLGHTRFQEGAKTLKDGPDAAAAQSKSRRASEDAGTAAQAVNGAMYSVDIDAIVAAYLQGRGARKQLKDAMEAVQRAIDSNAAVLSKWQRSSGDFKSAHELNPADGDAQANADAVDRNIAKLVDLQRLMMQMMAGMGQQREDLRQKMKKLKEKMQGDPGSQFKGGEGDDDDDQDKPPPEPKAGQQEGPTKNGKERQLSPEEAEALLGMLRLDADRKLPYGMSDTAEPLKKRNGRDW